MRQATDRSGTNTDFRMGVQFHLQQCAKWDKAHINLKNTPTPEGKSYIKHAVNLLTMLEPIAEIHPVAKAVVGCFKQVVLFEQDRQENDTRVASVVLAQTDMMRVLLDIDRLSQTEHVDGGDGGDGGDDLENNVLQSIANLPALLQNIMERITESHNSIDTYYKEHRLVKLYRAREWKDRMLSYIADFEGYRVRLHQALSMKVASGVNDLVIKMDTLLSRLFAPKELWEIETMRQLDALGAPDTNHQWIKDPQTLQALVLATGDNEMSFSSHSDAPQDAMVPMMNTRMDLLLERLKEDLQLSLDVLCHKNRDLFNLQLQVHTERLEQAIMISARMVIRTLEGPHDRLENEDLRSLWKEMNWFFCIETKIFSIAIFEYYLDLYSKPFIPPDASTGGASDTATKSSARVSSSYSYMPRFNAGGQFKSGSLNHPEAWTLDYLLLFDSKIAPLSDTDASGFIRISEANAFTANIPIGWTVPQWCAYLVEGQFHENTLYRKRIVRLRGLAHEMNAEILPSNQFASMSLSLCIDSFLHYLVLEPRTQHEQHGDALRVSVAPELHDLVTKKMLDQDMRLRLKLGVIKWTVRDESTIQVLFGTQPLEEWVLPFCYILMELVVDMHHAGTSRIMDFKDWLTSGYFPFALLEGIVKRHVTNLKTIFKVEKVIHTYHRGMWSLIEQTYHDNHDDSIDYGVKVAPITRTDVQDYYFDGAFKAKFPIPELTGALLCRQYSTWDEYIKDKDPTEIPTSIPITWNPIDANINSTPGGITEWPMSGWICDKCDQTFGSERRFHCVVCYNFDLCARYYKLSEDEHTFNGHSFSHLMLLEAVWCQPIRHWWISFRAEFFLEALREKISQQTFGKVQTDRIDDSVDHLSDKWKSDLVCAACTTPLVCGSESIYHCVEISCFDFSLCNKCLEVRKFPNDGSHFWWHTLLPIAMRVVKGVKSIEVPPDPRVEIPPAIEPDPNMARDEELEDVDVLQAFHNDVEQRVADVVHSVTSLESKIVSLQTVLREPPKGTTLGNNESILGVKDALGGITDELDKKFDDLVEAQTINLNRDGASHVEDTAKIAYDRAHMPESTMDIRLSRLESRVEAKMSSMEDKISGLESKMNDLLKGLSTILSSISMK